MNDVQLKLKQIPGQMETGLKTLTHAQEEFKIILPSVLNFTESTVKICVNLLEEINDKFLNVIRFVDEMTLSLISSTEGVHEQEISEVQRVSIRSMSAFKEQSAQAIQLFSTMGVRLDGLFKPAVRSLGQLQAMIGEQGQLKKSVQQYLLTQYRDEAIQVVKAAYFSNALSSTYYEMSSRFLIDRLDSLLSLLDAKTDADRQQLLVKLRDEVVSAQDAIKVLSLQKKEQYYGLVNASISVFDEVVDRFNVIQ